MYKIDKQIQIFRPNKERQSSGQLKEVGEPTLLRTCQAEVTVTAGGESENFNQVSASNNYRFVVRYTSTEIKPTDFVLYREKRIEITSVVKIEDRNLFLELKGAG